MSKRIIVPRGLINPEETTIIEIPPELEDEQQLLALRRSENRCPGASNSPKVSPFRPPHTSTPQSYTKITKTIIKPSTPDSSSLGLLGAGYFDSTRSSCGQNSGSMGLLGPGYFDSTQPTPSSMGLLGSGFLDTTRNSHVCDASCPNSPPSPRLIKTVTSRTTISQVPSSRDSSTLGILGPGYFDSTRSSPGRSMGLLGPGYFDSTRSSDSASLGVLGPGYFDSTQGSSCPGNRSTPRVIKKTSKTVFRHSGNASHGSSRPSCGESLGLLGSAYLDTTRETDSSLGILGSAYMDSTRSSCPGSRSGPRVVKKTSKTVIRSPGNEAAGYGHRDGVCPDNCNNSSHSHSTPNYKLVKKVSKTSTPVCGGGKMVTTSSTTEIVPEPEHNLSGDIETQLDLIEANERSQIEQDLANYQSARRRLVQNTTSKFSDTKKKCKMNHPPGQCTCT